MSDQSLLLVVSSTVDREISGPEKFSAVTFNDENESNEIFSLTYKWSKFILLSGHSDKNNATRKFNRRNILLTKNSRTTVYT